MATKTTFHIVSSHRSASVWFHAPPAYSSKSDAHAHASPQTVRRFHSTFAAPRHRCRRSDCRFCRIFPPTDACGSGARRREDRFQTLFGDQGQRFVLPGSSKDGRVLTSQLVVPLRSFANNSQTALSASD